MRHTRVLQAALLGLLLACNAMAQQPLEDVSVDDLIAGLGGGAQAKAFRRTAAPDITTNTCTEAAGNKNLIVVPYAGEGSPSVNLAINFSTDSDALSASDRRRLDTLASALNSATLRGVRFAVAGHTDAVGNPSRNLELSCARAIGARNYLAGRGVAPDRLSAYGFGSHRLLISTSSASAANRRVEIRRAD